MEVNNNISTAVSVADLVLSSGVEQYAQTKDSSARPSVESAPSSDSRGSAQPEKKLTKQEAEKEAKELEVLLNKPADTEIKFNVKLVSTGSSEDKERVTDFKFQVVEKGTGKVIRQFPIEDINGVKQRAKTTPVAPGILIDKVA